LHNDSHRPRESCLVEQKDRPSRIEAFDSNSDSTLRSATMQRTTAAGRRIAALATQLTPQGSRHFSSSDGKPKREKVKVCALSSSPPLGRMASPSASLLPLLCAFAITGSRISSIISPSSSSSGKPLQRPIMDTFVATSTLAVVIFEGKHHLPAVQNTGTTRRKAHTGTTRHILTPPLRP